MIEKVFFDYTKIILKKFNDKDFKFFQTSFLLIFNIKCFLLKCFL